jgi:hypothetical protein
MKTPLLLILSAILLTAAFSHLHLPAIARAQPLAAVPAQSSQVATSPAIGETVIEPGLSVGPLKLGDSRARALELFPRKDEDQEWEDQCGTTLFWVDRNNPMGRGDLSIHLKKDKVFQIESATTRFHTAEGITTFDSPDKVVSAYKDLVAYTLLTPPRPALGDRPLVFWVDKKKGIAFVFAYYPAKRNRYVYKIIVFVPNKTFCPEGETTNSPKWQQIDPYSLEPPGELAPNPD